MLNGFSVKLTLTIITVISVVKFIACACIAALGIYQITVDGKCHTVMTIPNPITVLVIICTCVPVCVCICVCCTSVYYMCVCARACSVCVYMCACVMRTCVQVCVFTHTRVCVYICVHVCCIDSRLASTYLPYMCVQIFEGYNFHGFHSCLAVLEFFILKN